MNVGNKSLRTTLFDGQIIIYRGNDSNALNSLTETLQRTYPVLSLSLGSEQHISSTGAQSSISKTVEQSSERSVREVDIGQYFQDYILQKGKRRTVSKKDDHMLCQLHIYKFYAT